MGITMNESALAKWLRWLVYSSALIPLVIFAQFISPFHFGKVVVFRSIVELMTALYLLLIWRDRSYLPKRSPILWAFVAYTAAFTFTSITGVAWLQSFWGTLERMGGLFTFWHYLVFAVIATGVLRTRRDWQTLLDLIVSVGVISALYGYLQRFNCAVIIGSESRERIFGTIGNPALFAGYQILVAYLALTLAFMKRTAAAVSQGMKAFGIGVGAAVLIGLLSNVLVWLAGLWVDRGVREGCAMVLYRRDCIDALGSVDDGGAWLDPCHRHCVSVVCASVEHPLSEQKGKKCAPHRHRCAGNIFRVGDRIAGHIAGQEFTLSYPYHRFFCADDHGTDAVLGMGGGIQGLE